MVEHSTVDKHNVRQLNYYELFGVSDTVADEEIPEKAVRRSFRRFSLLFHPDKDGSSEAREAFEYVNKALETLLTPPLRRAYDASLKGVGGGGGPFYRSTSDVAMRAAEEARKAEEVLTAKDAMRKAALAAQLKTEEEQAASRRQFVADLTQQHDAPFRDMEREIISDWNIDESLLKQKEREVEKLLKELWEHNAHEGPSQKRSRTE